MEDMIQTDIVRTEPAGPLADTHGLNDSERKFCELYAKGDAPYAGNPVKCYREAFNADKDPTCGMKAYMMLSRNDVQAYLSDVMSMEVDETKFIKEFVKTNMMSIVAEMSHNTYTDRNGKQVSPAPSRSVAVSAAKLLMDLYKIREPNSNELNISNKDGGSITFNVIVPESKRKELVNEE